MFSLVYFNFNIVIKNEHRDLGTNPDLHLTLQTSQMCCLPDWKELVHRLPKQAIPHLTMTPLEKHARHAPASALIKVMRVHSLEKKSPSMSKVKAEKYRSSHHQGAIDVPM